MCLTACVAATRAQLHMSRHFLSREGVGSQYYSRLLSSSLLLLDVFSAFFIEHVRFLNAAALQMLIKPTKKEICNFQFYLMPFHSVFQGRYVVRSRVVQSFYPTDGTYVVAEGNG